MIGPYSYFAGAMSLDFGGRQGSATASGLSMESVIWGCSRRQQHGQHLGKVGMERRFRGSRRRRTTFERRAGVYLRRQAPVVQTVALGNPPKNQDS